MLSDSFANAASYESGLYRLGLLTYYLLKGIRGTALRSDGNKKYVDIVRLLQQPAGKPLFSYIPAISPDQRWRD